MGTDDIDASGRAYGSRDEYTPMAGSIVNVYFVVEFSKAEYLERAKAESRGEVIRDGW